MASIVSVTSDWLMNVENAPGSFGMGTLYPVGAALVGVVLGLVASLRVIPPEGPVRTDPVGIDPVPPDARHGIPAAAQPVIA